MESFIAHMKQAAAWGGLALVCAIVSQMHGLTTLYNYLEGAIHGH